MTAPAIVVAECVNDSSEGEQNVWASNAIFIAAARSDIPRLVKALRIAVNELSLLAADEYALPAEEQLKEIEKALRGEV